MKTYSYRVKFLTPAFLGNAEQAGINWGKAIDVFLSLFLSPLFGAGLAGLLLFALLKLRPLSNIHKSPFQRQQIEGRKHPPFWARFMLIVSSMGMSFSHGSNDGQKGVGLVMLVLIALAPAQFVVLYRQCTAVCARNPVPLDPEQFMTTQIDLLLGGLIVTPSHPRSS